MHPSPANRALRLCLCALDAIDERLRSAPLLQSYARGLDDLHTYWATCAVVYSRSLAPRLTCLHHLCSDTALCSRTPAVPHRRLGMLLLSSRALTMRSRQLATHLAWRGYIGGSQWAARPKLTRDGHGLAHASLLVPELYPECAARVCNAKTDGRGGVGICDLPEIEFQALSETSHGARQDEAHNGPAEVLVSMSLRADQAPNIRNSHNARQDATRSQHCCCRRRSRRSQQRAELASLELLQRSARVATQPDRCQPQAGVRI